MRDQPPVQLNADEVMGQTIFEILSLLTATNSAKEFDVAIPPTPPHLLTDEPSGKNVRFEGVRNDRLSFGSVVLCRRDVSQ